jgi:monoamine oxidase
MDAEVIVIGAGLGGLSTARALARARREVIVLEARPRIGGRLLSRTLQDGTSVDLGGQWYGPRQRRVLALVAELGLVTHATFTKGRTVYSFNGHNGSNRAGVPLGNPLMLAGIAFALRRLSRLSDSIEKSSSFGHSETALDRLSLQAWLRAHVWPESARSLMQFSLESLFCCSADQVSMLQALFCLQASGSLVQMLAVAGGAQERQVTAGSKQLVEGLASELAGRIRLGMPVERIEQRGERVRVLGHGFALSAAHVVLAIPPPLLLRIDFRPSLSSARMRLLGQIRMGSVVKSVAVYRSPFWREKGLCGTIWSDRGPLNGCYDSTPQHNTRGVLALLSAASAASELRELSPLERKRTLLGALAARLGDEALAPDEFLECVWADDAWTGGGYAAHVPPGAFAEGAELLRKPEGLLHWAGTETGLTWPGYMEGALESGERAAKELSQ